MVIQLKIKQCKQELNEVSLKLKIYHKRAAFFCLYIIGTGRFGGKVLCFKSSFTFNRLSSEFF